MHSVWLLNTYSCICTFAQHLYSACAHRLRAQNTCLRERWGECGSVPSAAKLENGLANRSPSICPAPSLIPNCFALSQRVCHNMKRRVILSRSLRAAFSLSKLVDGVHRLWMVPWVPMETQATPLPGPNRPTDRRLTRPAATVSQYFPAPVFTPQAAGQAPAQRRSPAGCLCSVPGVVPVARLTDVPLARTVFSGGSLTRVLSGNSGVVGKRRLARRRPARPLPGGRVSGVRPSNLTRPTGFLAPRGLRGLRSVSGAAVSGGRPGSCLRAFQLWTPRPDPLALSATAH